ncbi:MAG: hypothetical protein P8J42_08050, partial [Pseudomonadales bacterium]|nr:hypothetical protein [Pseudomonadales bacterium]
PIKNPQAMAAAIENLLLNTAERKRYGKLARKRIEEKFSWTLAAKELTALYYQILDGGVVSSLDNSSDKGLMSQEQLIESVDFSEDRGISANH